jgi:predicted MPP superfamily phosphohydrolase
VTEPRGPHRAALGAAAVVTLGAGALLWSLIEAQWFALRSVRVPVLPPGTEPIRVLHITDLHLVPRQHRKRAWVRSLADLRPDLVVDTGDNLAAQDAVPAVLDDLDPLLSVPGAFVLGSNDYFAPKRRNPSRYLHRDPRSKGVGSSEPLPWEDLTSGLRARGWKDLTNARDAVVVKGVRIALVGVDDPHLNRDRFPARGAGGPGTRHDDTVGLPTLRLGVAHAPYRRVLDLMRADGSDLILAGHTHGGQLCLPFYGALVTNCDLDRGRAKGLHGWPGPPPDAPGGADSTWLHVSAGLGTSPYTPVRFACRPEATLLELVAR